MRVLGPELDLQVELERLELLAGLRDEQGLGQQELLELLELLELERLLERLLGHR